MLITHFMEILATHSPEVTQNIGEITLINSFKTNISQLIRIEEKAKLNKEGRRLLNFTSVPKVKRGIMKKLILIISEKLLHLML